MATTTTNTDKKTAAVGFEYAENIGVLTMTFADGETAEVELSELSPEIAKAALVHGLRQKLGDAAAMLRNPDTFKPASLEDKKAAVMEVYTRITSPTGTWNKVRGDGTGASSNNVGLLYRALCQIYPTKDPEKLRAWLDGKSDTERAEMRRDTTFAAAIAKIKADDAAKKARTGGLVSTAFDGLDDVE